MKKPIIIIGTITVLLIAIIGVTYAYFSATILGNNNATSIIVNTGVGLSLTYHNGNEIRTENAIPGDSWTNTFTVKNNSNQIMYYAINLTNVTNTFVNKNELVYTLTGSNAVEETIIPDTNEIILENIPIEAGETHTYTLTVKFKNTGTEQNANQNKIFMCKIEIIESFEGPALIFVDKDENMIPIMWDGSKWVKADETNENTTYKWYDYDNFQWANAVLVTNASRTGYKNATVGTEVKETNILAYYVYIPRYKYKLFNTNNEAIPVQTIEIKLQNKYDKKEIGTTNGQWLTHPAFTFGTSELNGIWVGKFTTGSSGECNTTSNETNCLVNATNNMPRIKPNIDMWRYTNIAQAFEVSKYFKTKADYGISGNANIDSHMMKNMEWGAVAYLSQSKYGKRENPTYNSSDDTKRIYVNNYQGVADTYRTKTGCSGGSYNAAATTTPCSDNSYTQSPGGTGASTTGTIYGIYDMVGGANEYVMGNMVDNTGAFYLSQSTSGGGKWNPSPPSKEYYDSYEYSTSNIDHSRGKLGDATREIISTLGSAYGGWYNSYSSFPFNMNSWFIRGGNNSLRPGIFHFNTNNGRANNGSVSFRIVLTLK